VGNSIQDQLLKAGLANKKQATKARKAQHNKQKLKASGVNVVDESERLAEKAKQEQIERDRELNRVKQQQMDERAIQAQIKQLIEMNAIDERGDVDFRFTDGASIKSLLLQKAHRDALSDGKLVIVRLGESYAIVPPPVADKIAQRDESLIVLRNDAASDEAMDDEYADFKVPDDLMW